MLPITEEEKVARSLLWREKPDLILHVVDAKNLERLLPLTLQLFILASVFIWLGQVIGLFDLVVQGLEYPIHLLGLPDQAAVSFLFGFFRRDYGAAGFFDMKKMGLLTSHQLVVASVTLTLFVPCVAQFLMNIKERGMPTGLGLSLFVLLFSFGTGYFVHLGLNVLGVRL